MRIGPVICKTPDCEKTGARAVLFGEQHLVVLAAVATTCVPPLKGLISFRPFTQGFRPGLNSLRPYGPGAISASAVPAGASVSTRRDILLDKIHIYKILYTYV